MLNGFDGTADGHQISDRIEEAHVRQNGLAGQSQSEAPLRFAPVVVEKRRHSHHRLTVGE